MSSFIIVKNALTSGLFIDTPDEYRIIPYPNCRMLTYKNPTIGHIEYYYNYGLNSKGEFKSHDFFEDNHEGRATALRYIDYIEVKAIKAIRKKVVGELPPEICLHSANKARDFIRSLQD